VERRAIAAPAFRPRGSPGRGSTVRAARSTPPPGDEVNNPCGVKVDDLPHPTSTSVTCTPDAVGVTQPATCTATVTDAGAAPTAPSGTLTFSASVAAASAAGSGGSFGGGATCTVAPSGGGASGCTKTFTPGAAGATTIGAAYGGDFRDSASSGSTGVEVSTWSSARRRRTRRRGPRSSPSSSPAPGSSS
jgi:hypothetical protein